MTLFRPGLGLALAAIAVVSSPAAQARESAARIAQRGHEALQELSVREPRSRLFASHAKAVLVFPAIFKAGFVFGGQSGDGVLFINGRVAGFYNLSGGSFGFQAGAEKFSYALFLMNDTALRHLRQSNGFALGTEPSVAIINSSAAAEADSTTLTKAIYAFPFGGKGLMADLTLQGTKISHIHPR